jgi:hypothetical protein
MTHQQTKFRQLLFAVFITISCFNHTPGFSQTMPLTAASQLVLPADELNIKFVWKGDTLNTQWEPHAALLIPVKLPGCPKVFYMQFDTGARLSLLYTEKVSNIRAKYPNSVGRDSASIVLNQQFSLAGKNILAKEIVLKKRSGKDINWRNKKGIEVIGTLGMDLIENKVLVMNYPNKKLTITDAVPANLKTQLKLTKFMLMSNSILLPVSIQQKQVMLYFDSGSSAYELLTNKATCLALSRPNAKPVTQQVRSMDNTLTAVIYPTPDSMTIASQKLPIRRATYMEGVSNSQVEQMMKLGMGGMTGNQLFINSILVIDTRNKQFGILSSSVN